MKPILISLSSLILLSTTVFSQVAFDFSNVTVNNGNPESVRVNSVATYNGVLLDLVGVPRGGGTWTNGSWGTQGGVLSMDYTTVAGDQWLDYTFVDAANNPVVIDAFTIGVFDIDYNEEVHAEFNVPSDGKGLTSLTISETTNLTYTIDDSGFANLASLNAGNVTSTLPDLSATAENHAVNLYYQDTSSFSLRVDGNGGVTWTMLGGAINFDDTNPITITVPEPSVSLLSFVSLFSLLLLRKRVA